MTVATLSANGHTPVFVLNEVSLFFFSNFHHNPVLFDQLTASH
jgi:hypothetical protein